MSLGVVGLLLGLGLWLTNRPPVAPAEKASATNAVSPAHTSAAVVRPNAGSSPIDLKQHRPAGGILDRAIQDVLIQLQGERDPGKSRVLLERLRAQLLEANSKAEAVDSIRQFLGSGQDATTGLGFRVGPNHGLVESPTLRTALLDWLGQLDPAAAADDARHIFEAMVSSEEYAIALRNFAQGRPEERNQLRGYFDRMLSYAPWASQPSAGYLEALDVVPHLADPSFIIPLSARLASSGQTQLRHASLVALDRLVLANPTGALPELLETPALDQQPLVRASFFARADLRDASQRQLLERYLLSPSLSDRELDKFIRLFPNANRFVSHNLLTDSGGRSLEELAVSDAAALEQVRQWQTEPRFSSLQSRLRQLETRLKEHVDGAVQGGHLGRK